MFILPISVACDLTETSFEHAFTSLHEKKVTLYVSPFIVSTARHIQNTFREKIYTIIIKPDWTENMWMVCGQYAGIFSEGA